MKFEEAQLIDQHLIALIQHANDVLYVANNSDDEQLKSAVKRSLGNAVASIDCEIWELIYRGHPELRPPEMTAVSPGKGTMDSDSH